MRKNQEQMRRDIFRRIPELVKQLVEVSLESYPSLLKGIDLIVATHSCKPQRAEELYEHIVALVAAEAQSDPIKRAQLRMEAFCGSPIDVGSEKFVEVTSAEKVEPGKGGFDIKMSDGWSFWADLSPDGYVPQVGSVIRQYRLGICHILGIVIDGHVFRYKTLTQDRAEHEAWVEQTRMEARKEFPVRDKLIAELPEVFQQRIHKFQRAPHFREDLEGYELSVCQEAVAIAARLKTERKLQIWSRLSYAHQRQFMPELSDGHSGNSFHMSVVLAWAYLTDPALVPKVYGAMAPLVGSDAYLPLEERGAA